MLHNPAIHIWLTKNKHLLSLQRSVIHCISPFEEKTELVTTEK